MNKLNKDIEDTCWRICAKLSANDKDAVGVLPYIELHTAMLDFVNFQRDVMRLEEGNERLVYDALCFIEDALLVPLPNIKPPNEWFGITLHTLMRLANAKDKPLNKGKAFLKYLSPTFGGTQD